MENCLQSGYSVQRKDGLGYMHMNVSHRRIYWKEQKENMHVILKVKVNRFFKDSEKKKWPVSQC